MNQQIATTSSLPGWMPVISTWSASGDSAVGHGVCAEEDAWAFGVTFLSTMPSASFHPNVEGQYVLARGISTAIRASLAG